MNFQSEHEVEKTDSYRVEVSGWDASENFFVENTVLHWSGDEKREITLRPVLREGSVVFIRLLQPFVNIPTFPVPYRAAGVVADANGRTVVRLARLHPRIPFKQEASASEGSESKVA
ncbi:MAG: hypothetical protein ABSE45_10965 [Candidatus Acidiferrales bacterium]|jgi:hypothetical protein